MIDVRQINLLDHVDEMVKLSHEHWAEVEQGLCSEDRISPNMPAYYACSENNSLMCYGAFDGDKMVGYASAIMSRAMHYDMQLAVHDLLYVKPEYRKGSTGIRLMRAIEDEAKRKGAEKFFWVAKSNSIFNKILVKLKVEETIYSKNLCP